MFAEVRMPFIPWLSILVIIFSFSGAIGLIKYRLWGFYGLYLTYLFGTLIVWFPVLPSFISFKFLSEKYGGFITLFLICVILGKIIYLHVVARKRHFFAKLKKA
jgi:cytochrome c biogenesis factor